MGEISSLLIPAVNIQFILLEEVQNWHILNWLFSIRNILRGTSHSPECMYILSVWKRKNYPRQLGKEQIVENSFWMPGLTELLMHTEWTNTSYYKLPLYMSMRLFIIHCTAMT